VTVQAPPESEGAFAGAFRSIASAAFGGILAVIVLLAFGQILGVALSLAVRSIDPETASRVGLVTSLAAFRADVVITFPPSVGFGVPLPLPSGQLASHLVPMGLTLGFLWIAARAGRRAARTWPEAPALVLAAVAAAGAGVSVAFVAALAARWATLSFPGSDVTVGVSAASAAAWGGLLAAGASALGAYLEGAAGRASAAVIRGSIAGYLWALGLLVAGVVAIATLEPDVTRRYVDGLAAFGAVGSALFGAHVLALPAQSALLLVPASGSCVDLLASGTTALQVCPWSLDPAGPLADAFLPPDPVPLSPWFWALLAIPPLAAFLGGRLAGAGVPPARGAARGALAGIVFAVLGMLGAAFAAPRVAVPFIAGWLRLEMRPWSLRAAGLLCLGGVLGGAIGGRLARRVYEEPELPRPTSA
jgi:hypothetical protein